MSGQTPNGQDNQFVTVIGASVVCGLIVWFACKIGQRETLASVATACAIDPISQACNRSVDLPAAHPVWTAVIMAALGLVAVGTHLFINRPERQGK
jgi:hypothetical protein